LARPKLRVFRRPAVSDEIARVSAALYQLRVLIAALLIGSRASALAAFDELCSSGISGAALSHRRAPNPVIRRSRRSRCLQFPRAPPHNCWCRCMRTIALRFSWRALSASRGVRAGTESLGGGHPVRFSSLFWLLKTLHPAARGKHDLYRAKSARGQVEGQIDTSILESVAANLLNVLTKYKPHAPSFGENGPRFPRLAHFWWAEPGQSDDLDGGGT
jgi:hypothetical protein